jgi:flagellar basal body rod protein FlgG
MNRGIYPVLAGAITKERQLELLSHNLGNLQTAGFKSEQPVFETILAQSNGPSVPGLDLFPRVEDVRPDHTQGTLRHTGFFLDVAIEGQGFLAVSTPAGIRHIRGGSFRVDDQKRLVTHAGDPVLGTGGPIELKPGEVVIDKTGTVRVDNAVMGELRIDRPSGSGGASKAGDLYWILPDQVEEATGVTVHQGTIEQTNVNASLSMVDMIKVTRGYEQMQKAIQSMDELTAQIIQSSKVQ